MNKKLIFLLTLLILLGACAAPDSRPVSAVVITRAEPVTNVEISTELFIDPVEDIETVETETAAEETTTEPAAVVETAAKDTKPISSPTGTITAIINLNSKMYHLDLECSYVKRMNEENKYIIKIDKLSDLEGYTSCSRCGGVAPETTTTTAVKVTETPVTTKAPETTTIESKSDGKITVIVNLSSKMYHLNAECTYVQRMNAANKHIIKVDKLSELDGYTPCSRCGSVAETTKKAPETTTIESKPTGKIMVIINLNSKMYHLNTECTYVKRMNEENKYIVKIDNLSELEGYTPCSRCGDPDKPTVTVTVTETTVTAKETDPPETTIPDQDEILTVIFNLTSKTFHADDNCRHIQSMKDENKGTFTGTIEEIFATGYKPCGTCSKQYILNN
ncbi:MAG: hypothetical protein FWF15_05075 [Oscillospiraceae bacterium]|nr:hypothetical protein [Oscillospiraceae bacterium]